MSKTDYNMVVMTYVCVIAQLVTSYMVKDASWFNVVLLAYTFGGCMTHLLWSSKGAETVTANVADGLGF